MNKKDFEKIIYSLHPLEKKVIENINSKDIEDISQKTELSQLDVLKGLQLLEQRSLVKIGKNEAIRVVLDKWGLKFVDTDLPEIKFLKSLKESKKSRSELDLEPEEFSSAIGILKRNKLVNISKEDDLIFEITKEGLDYLKNSNNNLGVFKSGLDFESMNDDQKNLYDEYSKRQGFVKKVNEKKHNFKPSKDAIEISDLVNKKYKNLDLVDALTPEMLKESSWKNKEFRHYDVNVIVPNEDIARRHPMIEANNILRDIFVEMGFEEMEGPMVEIAFWNMDVMWIPQDHPARDEQDTFYLEGKGEISKDILGKVKDIHENGIIKTHTDKGEWSEKVASSRLLRTHSTSTSFRTLYELGNKFRKGEDINGKYFYIANNFRNETVDATHLAEFYQGEGFIVGDDLSLSDLMGFIKEYYLKLGIEKIKFKPTYNPYTEPSMEAHYYDPKMDKWYSLINSGIFRPETLKAFGLENKTIIAWGMGASRVAALLAQKDSMRDITGITCDFDWLKKRKMMTRRIIRK
mgnify:CR=1 FL=1